MYNTNNIDTIRGTNILVTGACGNIGSHLTSHLIDNDCKVTILLRPNSNTKRIDHLLHKVNTISSIDEIAELEIDTTFHLAWYGTISSQYNSVQQISINIPNTAEICDAVGKIGCKNWIGIGSQAEYGCLDTIITETTSCTPKTMYGLAKHHSRSITEHICYIYNMRHTWLRIFSTYGPNDNDYLLIPTAIKRFLSGETMQLTPGEQVVDYLYIDDAVDAIYAAASVPSGGIFNIASGNQITVKSIVNTIRDMIDSTIEVEWGVIPYSPDKPMFMAASISKLTEATNWKPKTDINSGLTKTIEWYRKNT